MIRLFNLREYNNSWPEAESQNLVKWRYSMRECPTCEGTGKGTCPVCKNYHHRNSGNSVVPDPNEPGTYMKCPECDGWGFQANKICPTCNGTRRVP